MGEPKKVTKKIELVLLRVRTWWSSSSDTERVTFTLELVTVLMTFLGILIAWFGLLPQLEEFNSKGDIHLRIGAATTTISFGPYTTDPIDISILAYNRGNFDPSQWRAAVNFCKNIDVVEADKGWINVNRPNAYIREVNKLIVSEISIFSESIDRIGVFRVRIKKDAYLKRIPIAILGSTGERTKSRITFVYAESGKLMYDPVMINMKNKYTNMSECSDVTFK